ncbi:MAG TPA: hypothetical protein VNC50_01625 [Planctomycetia bacterium]|jgi:hypothetical protein|nr:hypothetical protein [Planctomycetia bacterium]
MKKPVGGDKNRRAEEAPMEAPNRFVLIGYLEEALPAEQMARVEENLRQSEEWRAALSALQSDVDPGEHSVAQIWRRQRLTCISREKLGAFLLDAMPPDEADYVRFHLDVVKCRWCQANRNDLEEHLPDEGEPPPQARRKRFFQTSVGHLPKRRGS